MMRFWACACVFPIMCILRHYIRINRHLLSGSSTLTTLLLLFLFFFGGQRTRLMFFVDDRGKLHAINRTTY